MRQPLFDRTRNYLLALRLPEAIKLEAMIAASRHAGKSGYMLREGVTLIEFHRELRKVRAKLQLRNADASAFLYRARVWGESRSGVDYEHSTKRCNAARDGAPSVVVIRAVRPKQKTAVA